MIQRETLQVVAHPGKSGETGIAHGPVGQHAGDGGEDAKRLTCTHRIGREEGWYHHIGPIGVDILMLLWRIGILCLYPIPELGNERTEVIEGTGLIAVAGVAYACQRTPQRDGGHIKRATVGGGLAGIHILDATGTVVCPRGIEVDLQIADGFEHRPYLQIFDAVDGGGRRDAVVLHQPIVLQGLVDITVADETEGEIETW